MIMHYYLIFFLLITWCIQIKADENREVEGTSLDENSELFRVRSIYEIVGSSDNNPASTILHILKGRNLNGTSIDEISQPANGSTECYHQTVTPLLGILKERGLNIDENCVETTEISGWRQEQNGSKPSKLIFEAVINTKKVLLKTNSLVNESIWQIKKTEDMANSLVSEAVYFDPQVNASLMITVKDFYEKNETRIKINAEINSWLQFEIGNNTKLPLNNKSYPELITDHKFVGMPFLLVSYILILHMSLRARRVILQMNENEIFQMEWKYWKNIRWWMAYSLMIVIEIGGFLAFHFGPALRLCLLQNLMIFFIEFGLLRIARERMDQYRSLSLATWFVGFWVTLAHEPVQPQIHNIEMFLGMVTARVFVAYNLFLIFITLLLIFYFIPKWGQTYFQVFAVQSAIFGSIILVALQGAFLVSTDKSHWMPYTCVLIVVICFVLHFKYLNRALISYDTLIVLTQYYVLFTALVITSMSLLFKVWNVSNEYKYFLLGFLISVMGVYQVMISSFPEDKFTDVLPKTVTQEIEIGNE